MDDTRLAVGSASVGARVLLVCFCVGRDVDADDLMAPPPAGDELPVDFVPGPIAMCARRTIHVATVLGRGSNRAKREWATKA